MFCCWGVEDPYNAIMDSFVVLSLPLLASELALVKRESSNAPFWKETVVLDIYGLTFK